MIQELIWNALNNLYLEGQNYFRFPWVLLCVIPAFIILVLIIKKDLYKGEIENLNALKFKRFLIFLSRMLVFALLIFSLAQPFHHIEKETEKELMIKVLLDNSTSYSLFDSNKISDVLQNLEKNVVVDSRTIGSGETSPIGDQILNNLKEDANLLLISDGNNNFGSDLGDVLALVQSQNSTVSLLEVNTVKNDASIAIEGPSKTVMGLENAFDVVLQKAGSKSSYHVVVEIDDEIIFDQVTENTRITVAKRFDEGFHKIVAKIIDGDHFSQNNVFYKSIKVVPRPRILFASQESSPLLTLFKQIYNVTKTTSLGNYKLNNFHTVVLNDLPNSKIRPYVDDLVNFTSEGNGLVVVGGSDAYEFGGYKGSEFEELLPVKIGKPGLMEGDVSVVFLIDISVSRHRVIDVEKNLAMDIIQNMDSGSNVGIIAFNTEAHDVYPLRPVSVAREDSLDAVSALTFRGGTKIYKGIERAIEILRNQAGTKNIILISDGNTQGTKEAYDAAQLAANNGIKIFTVNVNDKALPDQEYYNSEILADDIKRLQTISKVSNGIYFKVDEYDRLNLLFGEKDEEEKKKDKFALVVMDAAHFITQGLALNAFVTGYNQVVPKLTAQYLIITDSGMPLVVSWHYGLGRVITVATDDGKKYSAELLNKENSKLYTRILNYAIGNPDRTNLNFVDVKDTRVNDMVEVLVKSEDIPIVDGLDFKEMESNLYASSFENKGLGFSEVLNNQYAVNYQKEYEDIGIGYETRQLILGNGGKIYTADDWIKVIEDLKTDSKRTIVVKENLLWPFLALALLIILVEMVLRRIALFKKR
jgi:hypothetical protein